MCTKLHTIYIKDVWLKGAKMTNIICTYQCKDCRHNPSFRCVKCYEHKHFEAKEPDKSKDKKVKMD